MNRTGLAIALGIGAVVGTVFGLHPQLDLVIAAWLYDPAKHVFLATSDHVYDAVSRTLATKGDWVVPVRDAATALIALLAAPAFLAILGKLVVPNRRMLIPGRAALFLSVTLVIGPFLLANVVLKDTSGRMRPIDIVQFGGTGRFTAWWDPSGPCTDNCSFVGGEAASAFWTLAPAALTPPQWRPLAYGAALAFGAGIGALRMASGGHFFTDTVFAGVLTFLVVWAFYGAIYRWRGTRLTDEAVEGRLERAGKAIHRRLAALAQLLGGKRQRS
jgi:lipid A 4'-phosphatase